MVARAGPVTMGYGGPPGIFVAGVEELLRRPHGRSGGVKVDDLQQVVIWAQLIEVNDFPPPHRVEGSVVVNVRPGTVSALVEHVATRVTSVWDHVRVFVERLRR